MPASPWPLRASARLSCSTPSSCSALIVSLPLYGFQVAYLTVAIIGVLLLAFLAGLVVLFTKGDERAAEAGAHDRRQGCRSSSPRRCRGCSPGWWPG